MYSDTDILEATPPSPPLVADFVKSALFDRTFREGMALVEETAAYLDGAGRQESRQLSRPDAMLYAAESMRLTTGLMDVASWLLLQREVRDGKLGPDQAAGTQYRLNLGVVANPLPLGASLPAGLLRLMQRSEALFDRVRHLDRRLYLENLGISNPVASQLDRLRLAFEV